MTTFALSMADTAHEVRGPRPGDAIGAALRGAFGCAPLSDDMVRLLQRLDRTR